MSYRARATLFVSCCLLGGLLGGCATPGDEGTSEDPAVAEASSAVKSCGVKTKPPTKSLVRKWTRWAMEEPWTTGPIKDPTGAACADGQEGHTWFLAGTTGGPVSRTCTIPRGKDLFFPLVNNWCVFPPEWYPDQASIEADLPLYEQYYEESRAATCSLTVKVDGQDVYAGGFSEMMEDLWVIEMDPFEVDLNEGDNFVSAYGVAGGEMPATAAGHFARLKALPPGDHVVELGGSRCDGGDVYFETSATYHIHIN